MNLDFSDVELALLKGKYASLARKYNVSTSYVKLLSIGKRKASTTLSKKILKDIQSVIKLFTPLSETELEKIKDDRSGNT